MCNFIVGEKNGEFALKIDSEQLSEQEQEQEYLTKLGYENNSLTREREGGYFLMRRTFVIYKDVSSSLPNLHQGVQES